MTASIAAAFVLKAAPVAPPVVIAPVVPAPTHVSAAPLLETAKSERNLSMPKRVRAVGPIANSPPSAAESLTDKPEFALLPPHLHVPPCQCTLRAVMCSCVE